MKIALLLHGHMRTYKKCYPSLKEKIIDLYKPDIFIHTWDKCEAGTISHHNKHMKINNTNIDKIIQLYNPVSLTVEKQIINDNKTLLKGTKILLDGHKHYFYGFYGVNELKKKYENRYGFEYDLVIKLRPDINLLKKFDILKFDSSVLNVYGNTNGKKFKDYTALNILAVSSSKIMNKYAGFYKEFDEYQNKQCENHHCDIMQYVIDNDIDYKIHLDYPYSTSWIIVRDS